MKNIKVWNEFKTGKDGRLYGVRYMLTDEELAGLQAAGIVGEVDQVLSMIADCQQIAEALQKQTNAGLAQ